MIYYFIIGAILALTVSIATIHKDKEFAVSDIIGAVIWCLFWPAIFFFIGFFWLDYNHDKVLWRKK